MFNSDPSRLQDLGPDRTKLKKPATPLPYESCHAQGSHQASHDACVDVSDSSYASGELLSAVCPVRCTKGTGGALQPVAVLPWNTQRKNIPCSELCCLSPGPEILLHNTADPVMPQG